MSSSLINQSSAAVSLAWEGLLREPLAVREMDPVRVRPLAEDVEEEEM